MSSFFAWLKKVPFIGAATSFVGGNVRLVIEYVLIGLVIACAATAIALWYRTSYLEERNDELRVRVTNAEVINEAQDQTITDLQDLRQQDAEVMAGLVTDFAHLSKSDFRARQRLSELEKHNETVRDYLDQRIPPDLVCLLNDSCTPTQTGGQSGEGSAAKEPAGAVQGARQTTTSRKP